MEDKADDERIFDWVEVQTLTVLCSLCRMASGFLRVHIASPLLKTFYPSCASGFCACMCTVYLKFRDCFYKRSVIFTLFIFFCISFLRQGLIMCSPGCPGICKVKSRLASNSQRSSCLCCCTLPCPGTFSLQHIKPIQSTTHPSGFHSIRTHFPVLALIKLIRRRQLL